MIIEGETAVLADSMTMEQIFEELEKVQPGLVMYSANFKQMPRHEYFSYLGQISHMKAAKQAMTAMDSTSTTHDPNSCNLFVEASEELFYIACKNGSVRAMREMIRIKPELAREKNKAGFYGLHLASTEGHIDVVRELVQLDPKLCLLTNEQTMIPLHIALINGHEEVTRILLSACPESLQWENSNNETALHVALKNRKFRAFYVLLEHVKEFHREDLLVRKDSSGNSVITLAQASPDQEEDMDSWSSPFHSNPPNIAHDSKDLEMAMLDDDSTVVDILKKMITSREKPPSDTNHLLLVVLGLFATFAFGAICSPPAVFLQDRVVSAATPILLLHVKDTIFGPNRPPLVFYYLVFITITYTASVGAMLVLLWRLPYTAILVLAAMAISIVFGIVVYCHTPRFLVPIGSITVPSSWFVWIFVLALVSSGFLAWLLSKQLTYLCIKKREKLKN